MHTLLPHQEIEEKLCKTGMQAFGDQTSDSGFFGSEQGHEIWVADLEGQGQGKLVYCNQCGMYSQLREGGLRQKCQHTTQHLRLRKLKEGKHPAIPGMRLLKPLKMPLAGSPNQQHQELVEVCTEDKAFTGSLRRQAVNIELAEDPPALGLTDMLDEWGLSQQFEWFGMEPEG